MSYPTFTELAENFRRYSGGRQNHDKRYFVVSQAPAHPATQEFYLREFNAAWARVSHAQRIAIADLARTTMIQFGVLARWPEEGDVIQTLYVAHIHVPLHKYRDPERWGHLPDPVGESWKPEVHPKTGMIRRFVRDLRHLLTGRP